MLAYVILGFAILAEVFASTMLKYSNGLTRKKPLVGMIAGYGVAFFLLAQVLRILPLGVVYATWSGIGTLLTAVVGVWLFREKLNKKAAVGIGLIIIGVVMLQLVE